MKITFIGETNTVSAFTSPLKRVKINVQAILSLPRPGAPIASAEGEFSTLLRSEPAQHEVERDLAQYEYYVANRDSMEAERLPARGRQS